MNLEARAEKKSSFLKKHPAHSKNKDNNVKKKVPKEIIKRGKLLCDMQKI